MNYFGAELYEVVALLEGRLTTLPGLALVARREIEWFHFGVRLGGATDFNPSGDELALTTQIVAQLEAAAFASSTAKTSWFAAVVVGLEHQRFRGRSSHTSAPSIESASATGFTPGLRFGLEFGRHTNTRASLFSQILLPTFVSEDVDTNLVKQWVPTLAIGAGMVF